MVATTDSYASASHTPSFSPDSLLPFLSTPSLVSPSSFPESAATALITSSSLLESTTSAPPSTLFFPTPPPIPLFLFSPTLSPLLPARKPKLVDGLLHSSCHQCKTTKLHNLVFSCRPKADPLRKVRLCRKRYCSACLFRTYGLNLQAMTAKQLSEWICPSCHDTCCCAACKRKKQNQSTKVTTQAQMIHPTQFNNVGIHRLHQVPLLASSHRAEVIGMGLQGDLGFRSKPLNDYLFTVPSHSISVQPLSDSEETASATLLYQLQQLHHLHEVQQTLQRLQALSPPLAPAAGALGADSSSFSVLMSSVNSPSHPSSQPRLDQSLATQVVPQMMPIDGGYDDVSQYSHHPAVGLFSAKLTSSLFQAHTAYLGQHRMYGSQSADPSGYSYPAPFSALPQSHFGGGISDAGFGSEHSTCNY
jgi:hypothetical protein